MFIRDSKDIIQVLMITFIDYLYRLFILAPVSTIKSCSRHPISTGLLFLCLFPIYLFIKFILFTCSFFIQTLSTATKLNRKVQVEEDGEEEDEEDEELQRWSERCSICFDAKLDLCLDLCRDQFCLSCFQRYVTCTNKYESVIVYMFIRYVSEVVKSSWGLCVTKIRCPVCRLHIPQTEWTRYVPKSISDLYDKFNQPYRSYSRCCPQCEVEVIPCAFEPERYYPR